MKFICLLAMSLSLADCAIAPEVTKETADASVFSHFRSYTWRTKPSIHNPLGQQRIIDGIDAQLRSRGWDESGDGDIAIVADVATSQKQTTSTFHSQGISRGWGMRAGLATAPNDGKIEMGTPPVTSVHTDNISTLAVRIFDAKAKKEIWRGAIKINVSSSHERNDAAIAAGIVALFSGFPSIGEH